MPNVFIPLDGYIEDTVQNKKYKVGDLYITKVDEEHKQKKDITCIFDFDKRNVHLYLDNYKNNEEVINKLESVIYELQNKIINLINNSLREMFREDGYKTYTPNRKDAGHMIWPDGQFIRYKNGDNKTVTLYKYISITINKISYELSYSRFFIDEDNRINCILCCPQFDRCTTKYVNSDGICYPHTPDSEKGQLKNIISVTETHFGMNNYCYNPGIEGLCIEKLSAEDGSAYFKYYACLLAEEFIEFINENESINVKNKEKYNLFLDGAKIPFYDYNQNEVTKKILDVSLGNYHLAPKNSYLKDCVAKAICNNLEAIKNHIMSKDIKILYENEGIIFNKGQRVLRKSTTYEQIYSYIRIQTEKYYYDLMGFRMGKDDSCISCKLKAYQFLCADKNTFIDNKQKFKSWQVYPGSLEDGVETLPSMKNPCKNFPDAIVFYHNPKTKFISKNDSNKEEWNKSIGEIVKEFLDFIKVNEGA